MRDFSKNTCTKRYCIIFFLILICNITFAQTITTVKGVVKDAATREKLAFVTVAFDGTSTGTFSDADGEFKISIRSKHNILKISLLGYKSQLISVHPGVVTTEDIYLEPEDKQLTEVVVRPKKEKYSKKNNPAVELIKKVIAHKDSNNIKVNNYFQYKEYERTIFAFNEFKPDKHPFKRYKFIPNYIDTSLIDNKAILPFSVREKISDVFFQKKSKNTKRIVKAYHIQGVDQAFETEGLDAVIKEVFKDISLYDNSTTMLFNDFVSPLSDHNAVNFYRWYISDTVTIDTDRYVKLDFAPFNSRDLGFTGNLYISLDSMFAVKRAILRAPKKMNINFVEELIIHHEFTKTKENRWVPVEERMAIDLTLLDAVKFYVDKIKTYENIVLNYPMDPVFLMNAPEAFEKGYQNRSKDYWAEGRPPEYQKDYKMDMMMKDINSVVFLNLLLRAGKIISTGYIPIRSNHPDKYKFEVGTLRTFYSYNQVEGNRFRLTGATTKNLHPNLYFYGYGAYSTRDEKFKYYGEATWSFRKVREHKDEFPKNNLTVAYKYDMNTLGQRYTQAERDNIFRSLGAKKNQKLTYNRQTQIAYEKEYYSGFSFKISGQTFNEKPAGELLFEKMDEDGNLYNIKNVQTTEAMLTLRYAPNEKFIQQRRKRQSLTAKRFVISLSHTTALEDILGGQYNYNKTSFSVLKDFWIAPFGKLTLSTQAEKIWGETPFPFLITPSANNSYTIQRGSFYLIEPLEFIHDSQVSWEVYYHMGGWLFNRIPLLNLLKWREVFGFRGFIGDLSNRNNPLYNKDLLIFPQKTYTTGSNPYMEYNVGIENIFKFFRIDYVRRLNYLDHPNIDKDGFRVSFELNF